MVSALAPPGRKGRRAAADPHPPVLLAVAGLCLGRRRLLLSANRSASHRVVAFTAVETRRSVMKIVVIGGTGRIGSLLVASLKRRGHEALPAAPQTGVD